MNRLTTTLLLAALCACQPAQYGGWETLPGPTMAAINENTEPYLEQLGGTSPTALDAAAVGRKVVDDALDPRHVRLS